MFKAIFRFEGWGCIPPPPRCSPGAINLTLFIYSILASIPKTYGEKYIYQYSAPEEQFSKSARNVCKSKFGYLGKLAIIHSESDERALEASRKLNVAAGGHGCGYIGIEDENQDGVWTWYDGSEVTYTNWMDGKSDLTFGLSCPKGWKSFNNVRSPYYCQVTGNLSFLILW